MLRVAKAVGMRARLITNHARAQRSVALRGYHAAPSLVVFIIFQKLNKWYFRNLSPFCMI